MTAKPSGFSGIERVFMINAAIDARNAEPFERLQNPRDAIRIFGEVAVP